MQLKLLLITSFSVPGGRDITFASDKNPLSPYLFHLRGRRPELLFVENESFAVEKSQLSSYNEIICPGCKSKAAHDIWLFLAFPVDRRVVLIGLRLDVLARELRMQEKVVSVWL